MATRIVTVDVDSTAIRLLQVEGNRVERWATAPLEAGVIREGMIVDPASLATQARQLSRSSRIRGGAVVASVSGLFSVARLVKLPHPSQERLFIETSQTVPGEDLQCLWQSLRTNGAGQDVLFVWADGHQVGSHTGALRAGGLAPRVLELKAMALSRLVNRSNALIVNAEPSSFDLVLVANSLPQVMRTVAVPETSSSEERASRLAQTLEHTVSYYNTHHLGESLPARPPLFLVGSMAEDPSLRQQIAEQMGYPLETFAPDLEYPLHLPVTQYAVNIGLALRQMDRPREGDQEEAIPKITINLVPRTLSPWRLTPRRAGLLGSLAAGLAVAYLLVQVGANAGQDVARLQSEVRAMEQEVMLKQQQQGQLSQVEGSISSFKNLTVPWGRLTAAMDAIQEILTPGMRITSVTVEANKAEFKASGETVAQVIRFVEVLRADGRFGAVPFPRPAQEVSFSLDLATLPNK